MKKSSPESWSEMWKSPLITTFGGEFQNNYDGPILDFWKTQLHGELNHVVDLACGNGALTWIANDLLNAGARKTKVTGVDIASIDPFTVLGRQARDFPEVRFIGDTSIEKLPFEDGSVDLIISQYGLEYSDLDKSIPEIARVLSPNGKMSFIMHARDGALVRGAIHPLNDYKALHNVIRFDELILELADAHDSNRSTRVLEQSTEYQDLMRRIESTSTVFRMTIDKFPKDQPLAAYRSILETALIEAKKKPAKRKHDLRKLIADTRKDLGTTIERKEDLIAASLTEAQLNHLVALIKHQGFAVSEMRVLVQRNNLNWGTILVADRLPPKGGLVGFLRRLLPKSKA